MKLGICIAILQFCFLFGGNEGTNSVPKRKTHKCKNAKTSLIQQLSEGYSQTRMKETLLRPIMRVRVAGTPENRLVQGHIRDTIRNIGDWTLEDDTFTDNTPIGEVTFNNIIATYDSDKPRKLVLACHHDSKLMRGTFIGATDSAVPCAMLLELAVTLTPLLNNRKKKEEPGDEICYCQCGVLDTLDNLDVGLQLMFFDGEEAFQRWTNTDSLYGSRHLAQKLHDTITTIYREEKVKGTDQIDMLVLLDLIGAGTTFYNWFPSDTGEAYHRMLNIEERLQKITLKTPVARSYFSKTPAPGSGIQDDHIPFLQKDVACLHLIAYPFPTVWHKTTDDYPALIWEEIRDITLIMKIFVCEYMHC